ncbi:hypothetical protein TW95_gp0163 [Pandoravirus inopinatum]|uniref:Uncharacterized protein n=1 Tax=Pandoravirus inopinatum TaxID=1605721 RepID=A0A0B5JBF8_9VIRU|nr:hypothetical protein TW95_gp0163 [Pandoravirus inopinatum]AJF96897.1 hypothetical protein [Pandoravirus inopinatum]
MRTRAQKTAACPQATGPQSRAQVAVTGFLSAHSLAGPVWKKIRSLQKRQQKRKEGKRRDDTRRGTERTIEDLQHRAMLHWPSSQRAPSIEAAPLPPPPSRTPSVFDRWLADTGANPHDLCLPGTRRGREARARTPPAPEAPSRLSVSCGPLDEAPRRPARLSFPLRLQLVPPLAAAATIATMTIVAATTIVAPT